MTRHPLVALFRKPQAHLRRDGFTLIELLVVMFVLGILAAITIMAINPRKALTATNDATRRTQANQMQNAFNQYVIAMGGTLPTALVSQIPTTAAAAIPICRYGVNDITCLNVDFLVPIYLVGVPVDSAETSVLLTGFKIYKASTQHFVAPAHLGELGGIMTIGISISSSSSSAISSAPPSFSATNPSNLAMWLKADAINTVTDGDPLPAWTDSSGNGNDAVLGSAGTVDNEPIYWQNTVNSLPTVRFDGVDDWLSAPAINTTAVTIFAVIQTANTNNAFIVNRDDYLQGSGNGIIAYSFCACTNGSVNGIARYNEYTGIGWEHSDIASDIQGPDFHVVAGRAPGNGTYSYYVDGSLDMENTSGAGGAAGPLDSSAVNTDIGRYFSDGAYLSGDLAEVLVYKRALSDSEITLVNNYLQTKYALP